MRRSCWQFLFVLLAVALSWQASAVERELRYIDTLPSGSDWQLLDTRQADQCRARSLKGARCLSADNLLGPHRRFPSLRDISWLLGTLDLSGDETLVVAGTPGMKRDFVAGVVYLAGQRNVWILNPPLGRLLASGKDDRHAGVGRSMSRLKIFTAHPRDEQIVLRQELWQLINSDKPLRLLDARSEAEYWGKQLRSIRGGHIPGAEHWLPGRSAVKTGYGVNTILYAHDPLESIALFVRLQAQEKNPVQVFIEGWRAWAVAGSLPADAESFINLSERINVMPENKNQKNKNQKKKSQQ